MKVLLVGHACSPGGSSEPGLTWNWAWHLSAWHDVWVIAHPERRANVERFLAMHPNPRLHFVWVTLPHRWDPWRPARGLRGIRLHYLVWQWLVLREAARLHRLHHFDVAHHVGWGTVGAPPVLWRLPVPFVWGPVGGGQVTPTAFRGYFGQDAWKEALRGPRVSLLPVLPALRRAVRRSALILATNRETMRILEAAGAKDVRFLIDNGLPPEYVPETPPRHARRTIHTFLWAGRLEPRKALPLALESIGQASDLPIRLVVAGDGPMRARWEARARELDLADRVSFAGHVPWERMPELFREADAFLFTSLRDSFGSVVLEAMAHALPILALDHQGVGDFVPPDASIKAPVTTPAETVTALSQSIRRLVRSPEDRWRMGEAAWAHARTHSWESRAAMMTEWYEECVGQHHEDRSATPRRAWSR